VELYEKITSGSKLTWNHLPCWVSSLWKTSGSDVVAWVSDAAYELNVLRRRIQIYKTLYKELGLHVTLVNKILSHESFIMFLT
jgi:hypothetical protein